MKWRGGDAGKGKSEGEDDQVRPAACRCRRWKGNEGVREGGGGGRDGRCSLSVEEVGREGARERDKKSGAQSNLVAHQWKGKGRICLLGSGERRVEREKRTCEGVQKEGRKEEEERDVPWARSSLDRSGPGGGLL